MSTQTHAAETRSSIHSRLQDEDASLLIPKQYRPLILAVLIAVFAFHVLHLRTLTDDTFISFRYARNFANGYGLVWNPGETPVEGYTNFLWVVLLSLFARAGISLEPASQVLGVLFAAATLALLYRFSRDIIALLLLVLSGPFASWATTGMETMMFTFLCFLGYFLHVRERETQEFPWSALAFLLAALTRPEGLLVFFLTLLHLLHFRWKRRESTLDRHTIIGIAIFTVPFLAYFVWRYSYYGFLLPNTFYMKVGSTVWQIIRGLKYAVAFFLLTVLPLLIFAVPFLRLTSFRISLAMWLTLGYTAYIIAVGGDYMTLFRFFVPILPFMALLSSDVLRRAWRKMEAAVWTKASIVAVLFLMYLLPSLNLEAFGKQLPLPQAYWRAREITYPRVEFARWQVGRLSFIGRWLRDHLPPDSSLAFYAIGAIGYYSGLKIYDESGLNDVHIAHLNPQEMGKGMAGHEKHDFPYILSLKPDYILFSRYFLKEKLPVSELYSGRLALYSEQKRKAALRILQNDYELLFAPVRDSETGEGGYLTLLERRIQGKQSKFFVNSVTFVTLL